MVGAQAGSVPLPPVDEVAAGVWVIPVPIPINPLRYVLVHALQVGDGLVLIDAGWDTTEAWDALGAGLARVGATVSDVAGVLVTHLHPDHYGLAGRVRDASGCWVGLHPADAALLADRYVHIDDLVEATRDVLVEAGVPSDEVGVLATASVEVRPFVALAEPDILIEDGARVELPGWELTAIHTPGHSPGHLCFREDRLQIVFTGDHVLPRITPNVSYHPQSGPDPLGDYLSSLERVRGEGDVLALPAHEWRFHGLAARVDELLRHHEQRLAEITDIAAAGAQTAWEMAQRLSWSRPWDRIEGFMRRMAVAEVHAHLLLLERRGVVSRVGDRPARWSPPT
ncbi:MAG: MBL fold metallo-hydrolase [Actinobacteria bacterium]|nr:MBL fold metallo-hydrolase [Actinomycetota bacterium]